jgi:hypothetical protein
VCELPHLATTFSVDSYTIAEVGVLSGTVFPENSVLVDGDLTIDNKLKASSSKGCSFGMTFKDNYVAVLDEAKVFINFITSIDPYIDQLHLEGSNDDWDTIDRLFTYSDVHEGWNYINFRDDGADKPAYNSYRFYGDVRGACRVTEFRLTGVEAIADESETYSCDPIIKIGNSTLSTYTNSITYSSDKTPLLTSIEPRFGSVLGGDSVTLNGENLLGNAVGTIFFDKRECIIDSHSDTSIVCTTSDKPYVPDTPLV